MVIAGIITIPFVLIGIYGTHNESFKINLVMAILIVLGVIINLISGIHLLELLINIPFIALLGYYAYIIKYEPSNVCNQSNNIE